MKRKELVWACNTCQIISNLPSVKHSCEATEFVNTTRFDRSLLSFIVFLFLPALKKHAGNKVIAEVAQHESQTEHALLSMTAEQLSALSKTYVSDSLTKWSLVLQN